MAPGPPVAPAAPQPVPLATAVTLTVNVLIPSARANVVEIVDVMSAWKVWLDADPRRLIATTMDEAASSYPFRDAAAWPAVRELARFEPPHEAKAAATAAWSTAVWAARRSSKVRLASIPNAAPPNRTRMPRT